MRGASRTEWGAEPETPESPDNPRKSPDWGEPERQQPVQAPTQTPIYHPHAPLEIPPDAPTTPPMPEKLPIGDPRLPKADLHMNWPRQGVYY